MRIVFFDYLFYKVYRVVLKSSWQNISEFATSIYIAFLLSINIITTSELLFKLKTIPEIFSNKYQSMKLCVILIILSFLIFLWKGRYKKIIERFSTENDKESKRGNVLVLFYLIISVLMIFVVALTNVDSVVQEMYHLKK